MATGATTGIAMLATAPAITPAACVPVFAAMIRAMIPPVGVSDPEKSRPRSGGAGESRPASWGGKRGNRPPNNPFQRLGLHLRQASSVPSGQPEVDDPAGSATPMA